MGINTEVLNLSGAMDPCGLDSSSDLRSLLYVSGQDGKELCS